MKPLYGTSPLHFEWGIQADQAITEIDNRIMEYESRIKKLIEKKDTLIESKNIVQDILTNNSI